MKKYAIPLAVFAAIGGLLMYALYLSMTGQYSPRDIPSPLIGKPVPAFDLPTIADPARTLSRDNLLGRVYLLNVWASWCVACREEHPFLLELSARKAVPIIGLNYKDKRADALQWLAGMGDPYETSIADADGRVGIDLGVYGVPETFVVDKQGIIRYKQIGPLTPEAWEKKIAPLIKQLS
jgi:cytochrome c biogenesis protein CcmG/thiol:disulfide interchange protein DsbE